VLGTALTLWLVSPTVTIFRTARTFDGFNSGWIEFEKPVQAVQGATSLWSRSRIEYQPESDLSIPKSMSLLSPIASSVDHADV
jgi:hypothetical protein